MAEKKEQLIQKPTYFEHKGYKFLVMDSPTDENYQAYKKILIERKVSVVVRACKPSYDSKKLVEGTDITFVDLPFNDGKEPPEDVINPWLKYCEQAKDSQTCVAVHCVAGLGRAPILVAIAIIENVVGKLHLNELISSICISCAGGINGVDAIDFIRKHRKGAFNKTQVTFIQNYQPKKAQGCCVIS